MTYMRLHFWSGGTEEQYLATTAVVHPADGLPAGEHYHVAGPTEGGFLLTTVWDSKQSWERFVNDVLLPSLPVEGGFTVKPEERGAEVILQQMA